MEGTCPRELVNTTLDSSLFEFGSNYMNLTFLYGCQGSINWRPGIDPVGSCNVSGYGNVYLVPGTQGPMGCDVSVNVPVLGWVQSVNGTELERAVQGGFEIRWKVDRSGCSDCTGSGGRCGFSPFTNRIACYCPNPPYVSATCSGAQSASISPPGMLPFT